MTITDISAAVAAIAVAVGSAGITAGIYLAVTALDAWVQVNVKNKAFVDYFHTAVAAVEQKAAAGLVTPSPEAKKAAAITAVSTMYPGADPALVDVGIEAAVHELNQWARSTFTPLVERPVGGIAGAEPTEALPTTAGASPVILAKV